MPEIVLYGKKLSVTQSMIQECHDLIKVANYAKIVSLAFLKGYDACGTLPNVTKQLPALKYKHYFGVAESNVKALRDADILGYDYTAEDYLAETADRCVALDNVYYDLLATYKRLNHEKQAAERYREMRKESRGRLIGGGFGIVGALKGIVMAEAFNLVTGAAHSLYNMADGTFTDSEIASRMRKIYETGRNLATNAVFDDVVEMMFALYDRINYTPVYSFDNRKALNIKNAVDNGEVPPAKLPGQVAEVLYRMPYDDSLYFWAFDLLGDPDGELEQYAKLFDKAHIVATPKVFGQEYRKIYEKYGKNPFFPRLIENPQLSLPSMFSQMYEEAVAGYDLPDYNGQKYLPNRQKDFYVHPGQYVYVSVDLKAPTTPGMYESYFKLRDNMGYEFGFGSYADAAFWVNINVRNEGKTVVMGDKEPIAVDGKVGKNLDESATMIEATVIDEGTDSCGEQSIALRSTDTGYQVLWSAVNNGTKVWDGYSLVKADSNPSITASDTIAVPTTAPGEKAEVSFDINIDSAAASADPLWMEYYMDAGSRGFCEFYFEAPAK